MASDYDKHMDLIRTHRPDVHEAIVQADPANFARTQAGLSHFDLTTQLQSDAESINAKFVKERSLPRLDILQQIELSIMETIQERRQLAAERLAKVSPDTMQFSVTPWAQTQIQKSPICQDRV
jgi:ribosome-binding protein aMBF1 (putative translation factor)